LGLPWLERRYGLRPELPAGDLEWLRRAPDVAAMYGLGQIEPMPTPVGFIQAGNDVVIGDLTLQVLSTPGHSAASVCFYHAASAQVIVGDVLFAGSIGRTDLPGGDLATLMRSIYEVLLPLGDAVSAYPGHGPSTTLGHERLTNPFLT
jgi:glyoxylase-like metal-dependent hydrolase (beta-lactamase superfamily II)